jgi:uncharacterized protein YdeI (YjbR/CyaY-like superfamily)
MAVIERRACRLSIMPGKPTFFRSASDLGKWFAAHHATAKELWVGYYKKGSGTASVTWPESVDEALSVGWIDGVRKRVDDMRPAGLLAFEARTENRSGIYSYEQRSDTLPEPYARTLKKNTIARAFFHAQTASYRKKCYWWVVSAKQEATRLKRLEALVEARAYGETIPEATRGKKLKWF